MRQPRTWDLFTAARRLTSGARWPWRNDPAPLQVSVQTPNGPRDEDFMQLALTLGQRGLAAGQLPIGAILVRDHRVIAEAYCTDEKRGMLAHPELLVLVQADLLNPTRDQRRQMTIYTSLEPCAMCLGAAMSFRLGRIVYALNAPADGAIDRFAHASFGDHTYPDYRVPVVTGGVLREEARALFRAFVEQSTDRELIGFASGVITTEPSESAGT